MSGEEKAAQIGLAVTEYQTAKVELAHVQKKVSTVADAYSIAADSMKNGGKSPMDRPHIEMNTVKFPYSRNPNCAPTLLNEAGVIALIRELESAEQRLKKADEEMKALGITNMQ